MVVTWEPVSRRQLQSFPATVTLAVHFEPINLLGNLVALAVDWFVQI